MSDYTKTTNFTIKDSLLTGNPSKVIKGSEFDTEFTNIATAITSKIDSSTNLVALSGLTSAADKLPYFTGAGTAAVTTFTAFARTLLDDADAATMRTTLGALSSAAGAVDTTNLADNSVTFLKVAAGAVVQVVSTYSTAGSSNATGTMADVTNGSLSITPKSNTNKILVLISFSGNSATAGGVNGQHRFQVLRGASIISDEYTNGVDTGAGGVGWTGNVSWSYLDSPATTSATTYKIQHRTNNTSCSASTSKISITLIEVKA